ncbi:hypothetical protein [Bdellovibrio sp. NC01]|uniref:hypothetical protein n=1 Tax=Bdellovibrio sp. NC01 TaxID=2220073 RepID=UPI001158B884|nr:hypothetical protein [Bdellovibrio sp. NC01]QDK36983.1 hypothetical protein DOE51_04940 [Bdellovibrio sp. NC01]
MKALLAVAVAFLAMNAANANELRKVVDGSGRSCDKASDYGQGMQVQMNKKADALTISLVKCELVNGQGQYVLESAVNSRSFKAINGEMVSESYQGFELLLVDGNSKLLRTIQLNSLEQTSQEVLQLNDLQQGTDLVLRAVKSYKSESGISDNHYVTWGSFRY